MAVIEYWSPIGTPFMHRLVMNLLSSTLSDLSPFKMSYFLYIYIRQVSPEINCDVTVAQPAPATPILHTRIRKKSSTTFIIEESTRKTTGVLLSPSERITPDTMLYRNTVGIPMNITTM